MMQLDANNANTVAVQTEQLHAVLDGAHILREVCLQILAVPGLA